MAVPQSSTAIMHPADDAKIREIAERVIAALTPERVLLFGSYAWGVPHEESDMDLYVVVPEQGEPGYRLARKAYRALRGVKVPVDIIVRTHDESERNAPVAASLDREVLEKAVVLCDWREDRVGRRGLAPTERRRQTATTSKAAGALRSRGLSTDAR